MAEHKKNIVVFLAAVALAGAALMVCPAPTMAVEPNESLTKGFSFNPDEDEEETDLGTDPELVYTVLKAVAIVVVLGVAAIYISKKFLPRIAKLSGKEIRVVETVHIGQRKAVHLLKIGDQRLLIGSTNESITTLAHLTDALSEIDLSTMQTQDAAEGSNG